MNFQEQNNAKCKTCKYYDLHFREYHRYPPNFNKNKPIQYEFPNVNSYNWCGEYRKHIDV